MDAFQVIEQAKAEEENDLESLIFLLDGPGLMLCKAIIAWQRTRVEIKQEAEKPEVMKEMDWLWRCCRYDVKSFASSIGVDQKKATEIVKQLKDLRLIYPDGTANGMARKLVGSRIRKEMSKYVKQPSA